MSEENNSFESKMDRLTHIVDKLESGDVALEESLNLYQEGVKLSKECDQILKNAEQKVRDLNAKEDQVHEQ